MRDQIFKYFVGAGAGVAAAVLFLAAIRAGAPALLLANLAPLPLMIAALGWGLLPGLWAVFVACAIIGAAALGFAPGYLLVIAGPSWLLAAFATAPAFYLKRPAAPLSRPTPGPGAIALAAAFLFIVIGAAMLTLMLSASGGYTGAVGALVEDVRKAHDENAALRAMLPDMTDQQLAEAMVQIAPIALAVSGASMQLLNLYLAARSVQLSGRLGRAWRDIPTGFRMPRWLVGPTAAALGVALLAPEPIDSYGLIVICALGALYMLEALAALHALSRFSPARPFMLGALYFACLAASLWVLPALAVLGLAESFADLRGRAARSLKPRTRT